MSDTEELHSFPVVPIKNTVLFPSLVMPLSIGRTNSVAAVEAALATEDKTLVVVTQRAWSCLSEASKKRSWQRDVPGFVG
jgi:ATP-dependent Lon protease